jgi:glycine/D-amino acid oxidase-like deaminating enzyme
LVMEGIVDVRDVAYTPAKHAERISGVKGAKAAFSFSAAHVWPRKMIHQLLEKLLKQGLQLHAHTPVSHISSDPDVNGQWTVETPRGSILAKKVVVCTNAYTSSILPQYKGKIVPVRGVCSHIITPNGATAPHLPSTYSVRHGPQEYDYLIPRADGSIIVGGARPAFWNDHSSWWDNTNDAELVAGTKEYFDNYMQRHFHGWENSGARLNKIWTGIMGYSSDLVPHLGEVPGKKGQYICAGFSGHGMPQILLASAGVARMVSEEVEYEETGLPKLFKTTQERLNRSEEDNWMKQGLMGAWKHVEKVPPTVKANI